MHEHPFNDRSAGRFLTQLLEVGPKKPLGYLPLDTIMNLCEVNPLHLAQYLQQRGLETREWGPSFCRVESGALYVYDNTPIQMLLDRNSHILTGADWPTEAHQFVVKVATTHAKGPSALFDLVADAFADYQNPGRIIISSRKD